MYSPKPTTHNRKDFVGHADVDNSVNWMMIGIAAALLFFVSIIGMASFHDPLNGSTEVEERQTLDNGEVVPGSSEAPVSDLPGDEVAQ